jgi:putative SOS response-associated peptidase YedK
MCGRFAVTTTRFNQIEGRFATTVPEVGPRYNISPFAEHPGHPRVRRWTHELVEMRWGLVPHWSKESKTPYSTFNAR